MSSRSVLYRRSEPVRRRPVTPPDGGGGEDKGEGVDGAFLQLSVLAVAALSTRAAAVMEP